MCMQCVAEGTTYVGGAVGALQVLKVRARGVRRRLPAADEATADERVSAAGGSLTHERTAGWRTPTTTTRARPGSHGSPPARPGGSSAPSWASSRWSPSSAGCCCTPTRSARCWPRSSASPVTWAHATVTSVRTVPCRGTVPADGIPCDRVSIHLTSGPTEGEDGHFEVSSTDSAVHIRTGDRLVVHHEPDNPANLRYFFQDFQRGRPLVLLAGLFAVAVLILGRWQGLRALAALGVTGVVLVAFAFPSILDGHDPPAGRTGGGGG